MADEPQRLADFGLRMKRELLTESAAVQVVLLSGPKPTADISSKVLAELSPERRAHKLQAIRQRLRRRKARPE